jgi:hypothetical protein
VQVAQIATTSSRRTRPLFVEGDGELTRGRNFLLASSGLNPSETAKTINSLHLRAPQGALQVQVQTTSDVQTFLAERRTQNILSAIEKGLQRTSDSFTAELARYRNTSWEALKRHTLEKHRGIVSGESLRHSTMRDVSSIANFGKSR